MYLNVARCDRLARLLAIGYITNYARLQGGDDGIVVLQDLESTFVPGTSTSETSPSKTVFSGEK